MNSPKKLLTSTERKYLYQIFKRTEMKKIASFHLILHKATETWITCVLSETWKPNSTPPCICIKIQPNWVITLPPLSHTHTHRTFVFQESEKSCWTVRSSLDSDTSRDRQFAEHPNAVFHVLTTGPEIPRYDTVDMEHIPRHISKMFVQQS